MQRSPCSTTLLVLLSVLLLASAACGRAALVPAAEALAAPAGTEFRLWQDAAIFTCVHRLLAGAGAGQRLWVEMYEFGRTDLAGALQQARARGVDVRLIVDGTVPVSARMAQRLSAAGLAVRLYPVDDHRHQIDHVKLLLTDGDALAGGMNWGSTSAANHDYAFETGQAAVLARLGAIYQQDWAMAGGEPAAAAAGTGPVAQTSPGQEIRDHLAAAIRQARRSVRAEVFVLTDPDVEAALAAASRRGASVRVLLDPNQDVNRPGYDLLRTAGVQVRWYPVAAGAKLHAKAALFDGGRLLLGSANWSLSGLSVNHELDLQSDDPGAATAFAHRFEADWSASA